MGKHRLRSLDPPATPKPPPAPGSAGVHEAAGVNAPVQSSVTSRLDQPSRAKEEERQRSRRPTGRDVAHAAGVSQTAVSFVLTGVHPEKISEQTRKRVLEVATRLGYRPNRLARSLRTRRTSAIGLLSSTMETVVAQAISGLQEAAWESGYHVILCNTHQSATLERQALDFLADLQVDGLVVVSTSNRSDNRALAAWTQSPLVLINRTLGSEDAPFPRVVTDYREGARLAVEHLLAQGCRRVAFAGMDLEGLGGSEAVRQRWEGYRQAVQQAGLSVDMRLVYFAPRERTAVGWREGVEAVEKFRSLPPEQQPDGVYAINDFVAAGVIGALLQAGIRVPQDVSVVGNDNTSVASHHYPQITSVDQRWQEAGRMALHKLLHLLSHAHESLPADGASLGEEPSLVEVVRPQLVVRQSTLRQETG